jgi:hypothetical protein
LARRSRSARVSMSLTRLIVERVLPCGPPEPVTASQARLRS